MIVVDASVAVKWFIREAQSDAAERLLGSDEVRIAPDHVLAEVGQVLLRRLRAGIVSEEQCREAMEALTRLLHLVPARDIAAPAFAIASAASCSMYDALYVALAERWDATLVTADLRLAAQIAAARLGIAVSVLGTTPA